MNEYSYTRRKREERQKRLAKRERRAENMAISGVALILLVAAILLFFGSAPTVAPVLYATFGAICCAILLYRLQS